MESNNNNRNLDPNNNNRPTGTSIIRRPARGETPARPRSDQRYSNFYITIQTNYRAKSQADYDRFLDRFEEVLAELYDVENLDQHVIKFHHLNQQDSWTDEFIKHVNIQTNIEEGRTRRGGRIHAHTLLQITHVTRIQVDAMAIREYVLQRLAPDVKGPIVLVKMINEQTKWILDYIRKDEAATVDDMKRVFEQLHM